MGAMATSGQSLSGEVANRLGRATSVLFIDAISCSSPSGGRSRMPVLMHMHSLRSVARVSVN